MLQRHKPEWNGLYHAQALFSHLHGKELGTVKRYIHGQSPHEITP